MKVWLKSSSHRKKIHITEVVIVVLYGLLSPIIAVSITKEQDNGSFCVPQSNSVAFYGGLLPNIAVFCIGLVFLFMSLRILRKVSLHNPVADLGFLKGVYVVVLIQFLQSYILGK